MRKNHILFNSVLVLAFVLSACGGTTEKAMEYKPMEEKPMAQATEVMMEEKATEAPMMEEKPATPGAMQVDTMLESPAWFSAALTDVRSGQTFSINDYKGKVVLVETLAQWCSNCKRQQGEVKALHGLLGERDDFVSIGLDIDPNESAAALKSYTDSNGFDWVYAVSPAEVSREIASLYGDQFLNPPSTPMLIIDRKGVAHPLPFGIKSADDLMKALEPYLNESM